MKYLQRPDLMALRAACVLLLLGAAHGALAASLEGFGRSALEVHSRQGRQWFNVYIADTPELQVHAFDMTYDWALYDTLRKIAQGNAGAADLRAWWTKRSPRWRKLPMIQGPSLRRRGRRASAWYGRWARIFRAN